VPTQSKTISFTFVACTDADGNNYPVVQIGSQVWMAENLKTTKYSNGDPIPNVTDATEWDNLSTGAYCDYDNTASNGTIYGKLYNWYAVDDSRNIAPIGWHVPTDAEWTTLGNYVGVNFGSFGTVAKALASTTNWASSTWGGAPGKDLTKNNSTGFTALPGGFRGSNGVFNYIGKHGYWWCSTEVSTSLAYFWKLDYDSSNLNWDCVSKECGFPVRLVRD
jgi:uncharacterized protein (TIGR02145 family)